MADEEQLRKSMIELNVVTTFGDILCGCSGPHRILCARHQPIADFACSLVAQAYEEALQIVKEIGGDVARERGAHDFQEWSVAEQRIRALQNTLSSLTSET